MNFAIFSAKFWWKFAGISQKLSGNDKMYWDVAEKCDKHSKNARNFRNLWENFIFHFIFSFVSLPENRNAHRKGLPTEVQPEGGRRVEEVLGCPPQQTDGDPREACVGAPLQRRSSERYPSREGDDPKSGLASFTFLFCGKLHPVIPVRMFAEDGQTFDVFPREEEFKRIPDIFAKWINLLELSHLDVP